MTPDLDERRRTRVHGEDASRRLGQLDHFLELDGSLAFFDPEDFFFAQALLISCSLLRMSFLLFGIKVHDNLDAFPFLRAAFSLASNAAICSGVILSI